MMIPKAYAIDISKDFAPARNFSSIGALLSVFIPVILIFSSIVLFAMLLFASYTYLRAPGGNQEELQKAKKTIKWALVGFIVILISFLLSRIVSSIFNFNLL